MKTYTFDQDKRIGSDGPALASAHEIATAIVVRIAHCEGDTLKAAQELGEIFETYGISFADLCEGIRPFKRDEPKGGDK